MGSGVTLTSAAYPGAAHPLRPVRGELLDSREVGDPASAFDDRKAASRLPLDVRYAHAAPFGQIDLDLPQALRKLARCSGSVAALMVVQSYSEMDQGLEKQTLGLFGDCPEFFEDLVALEKLLTVEQLDSRPEQLPAIPIHGL